MKYEFKGCKNTHLPWITRKIYIYTWMHTYIHKYINTYIHTDIHTYIHTYIRTYILVLILVSLLIFILWTPYMNLYIREILRATWVVVGLLAVQRGLLDSACSNWRRENSLSLLLLMFSEEYTITYVAIYFKSVISCCMDL